MHRLLLSVLCLGAVVLAADDLVKNKTAAGYYGGSADAPTQAYYVPFYPPPPQLNDRNVCDLDASVLLVTDHRRHGQNRAVRVRCSEIANYDEDSCNVCCQNAARRDRTLQNQQMYGFLAVVDELKHRERTSNENSDEDEDDEVRRKRSHDDHHHHAGEVEQEKVESKNWKADPQYKNLKCVCCAPKRVLPQPVYNYQQYPAQPTYVQPQPAAPQYPAQVPPAQGYQQPQPAPAYPAAVQPPVQQYVPQQPVQQYQPPQAAAPAYQAPAQQPVKSY